MTPQEDFVLRPATEADLPQIHALIHALAEYEHAPPGAVPVTQSDLREALFGPARFVEVLLASVGSQIAGYAMFFQNFSSWRGRPGIFLEDLFVQPELRRRGIGRALLRELARIALTRNCARMEWLVLDWNQPAISFYRSLGAAPLDEWTIFRIGGSALAALAD
ncbi:MAG TPA: GNAT family N-acetyltransferase [Bryobacteraceae bacterium]|jgi:GNAT superfamily N-acetyltransferase